MLSLINKNYDFQSNIPTPSGHTQNWNLKKMLVHARCCNWSIYCILFKSLFISTNLFIQVLKRFKSALKRGPQEFKERLMTLERQHVFVDKLVQLVKAVARESGNRKVIENRKFPPIWRNLNGSIWFLYSNLATFMAMQSVLQIWAS